MMKRIAPISYVLLPVLVLIVIVLLSSRYNYKERYEDQQDYLKEVRTTVQRQRELYVMLQVYINQHYDTVIESNPWDPRRNYHKQARSLHKIAAMVDTGRFGYSLLIESVGDDNLRNDPEFDPLFQGQVLDRIGTKIDALNDDEVRMFNGDHLALVVANDKFLFVPDSLALSPAGKKLIAEFVLPLQMHENFEVTVVSHSVREDSLLAGQLNGWSQTALRSGLVAGEMIKNGINPSRITAMGKSYFSPPGEGLSEQMPGVSAARTEILLQPVLALQ